MNDICFEKLLRISREGTKIQKQISNFLLNNSEFNINKISDISNNFSITNASSSRFVKAMKYSYFKDFVKDWNNNDAKGKIYNYEFHNKESGKKIAELIKSKKEIVIASSKRSRGISYFLNDGLEQIKIDSKYIGQDIDPVKVINSLTKDSLLILLTITGNSRTITSVVNELNKTKNKTDVIIISVSNTFTNMDFQKNIHIFNIKESNWSINNFDDYFHALVHISKLFYYIISYIVKSKM